MRPRARHLRVFVQAAFLLAFLSSFWALADVRVRGEIASLFLAIDPLHGLVVALTDWTLPRYLWAGLIVLAATAFLGRFFCGWICPLGTLQQLVSRLAAPRGRLRRERNRYRSWFAVKYLVLAFLLVWAAVGVSHAGWLDPISLLSRAIASGFRPLWHGGASPTGWISAALVVAILVLSAWIPRFHCRAVCPLGALMGLAARLAPLRIRRDATVCSGCELCLMACQGADEPLGAHRVSECHVCLNCIPSCPETGLRYGLQGRTVSLPTPSLDVGRRRFLVTAAASLALAPAVRVAGGGHGARAADAIRPPGALDEDAFLARCITCGACVDSCPTGALIPDLGRTGVDGLFTPVLVPRRGWCEPSCTRCGEVCPTGAIAKLQPAEKQAINGPAKVVIGIAFVDRGRCLPWAMDTPCIVCEEMCPTSPKAVWLEPVDVTDRHGRTVHLQRPHVDPALCTG
ncbi:MAG: 4Fe-4S binding protein, partial [Acidobacteria bacterium]|nr:4Fe-4S binding protein [Acidobacteriota bacterium]